MNHPVLATGGKEHVAAADAGAMQDNHDFGGRPLLDLEMTAIPDLNPATAVFPGRDLPLEGAVVERMVLGVDGEVIGLRVLGDTLGQSPRHEHTLVLKTEIPVERPGVMFLDHENG